MRVKKHKLAIEYIDWWKSDIGRKKRVKNGPLLGENIRAIICGPSDSGKTTVMLAMLISKNGLRYKNVYVYSKSLEQEKYQFLKKILNGIPQIGYHEFSNNQEVIPPDKILQNSVMIFDDISTENQAIVREYFSRGRHKGVDVFYICHSYARISKHNLRDNANNLFLMKMDDKNLHHVYASHVNGDMTFEKFREICRFCWRDDYSFLLIDKGSKIDEGRYRKCFNEFILL